MKKILWFTLISTLFISTFSFAKEGGESGGGGDGVEQNFIINGNAAVNALDQVANQLPWLDMAALLTKWNSNHTKVLATDEELFDEKGHKKAALNFPSLSLIKVNRSMWNSYSDIRKKMALALHEILGLSRYEIGNYRVSAWVFKINPNVLEFGPLGAVENGASFRPVTDHSATPVTVYVETDLDLQRVSLSFSTGLNVVFGPAKIWSYPEKNLIDPAKFKSETESTDWDGGRRRFIYEMTVFPAGNFALSVNECWEPLWGPSTRCIKATTQYVLFKSR